MQHPVDYKITVSPKTYVFRMYEGGCKSTMPVDDYIGVVRQLFVGGNDGENRDILVERMPDLIESTPDFVSYDVISQLGSEKLRGIAVTQTGYVANWFRQEADILEIDDE